MRYRNRGPRWGRRGIMGFPFMLFFIIFLVTHSFSGIMVGIAVLVILAIIFRAVRPGMFTGNTMPPYQQPQQQPYQPYQPTDQPYQPEYEPYQQGYQSAPPSPVYQAPEQQYQPPQQTYEEQPQAEYPQEMPPMQQH